MLLACAFFHFTCDGKIVNGGTSTGAKNRARRSRLAYLFAPGTQRGHMTASFFVSMASSVRRYTKP
jgi:hypothetical protein